MNSDEYHCRYRALMEDLQDNPQILAAILSGSRARGLSHRHSDTDIYVIVSDDMGSHQAEALRTSLSRDYRKCVAIDLSRHGVQNLAKFLTYGQIGTNTAWDRYALVHAVLEFDQSDGQVTASLQAKQLLTEKEKGEQVARTLPYYLNSVYRSTKSLREGNTLGARLDACHSLHFLVSMLFTLDNRVTPFNKFLEWELKQRPVSSISNKRLLPILQRIADTASLADQRQCFHLIADLARQQGFGMFIDRWQGKLDSI